MSRIKATVMGCGSSLGVPAAGNFWGVCNPDNPKNRRTRSSLLLQNETTNVLVDATPDVRIHLNEHDISRIDGLILTHMHSDHINGTDDLRVISYAMERLIPTYLNDETYNSISEKMGYIFHGSQDFYKPFLQPHVVDYGPLNIQDIHMDIFRQDHGTCNSLGVRVNDFAYSVDTVDLDGASLETLRGVKTWVVDGAGYKRENLTTHANLERVMRWREMLGIEQVYLIVLTGMMDYDALCAELPPHIRPAYDGLVIDI